MINIRRDNVYQYSCETGKLNRKGKQITRSGIVKHISNIYKDEEL